MSGQRPVWPIPIPPKKDPFKANSDLQCMGKFLVEYALGISIFQLNEHGAD